MHKIVPLRTIMFVCEVYSISKYYFKIHSLHQKNKSCRHYAVMLFRVNICIYRNNQTKHTTKLFRFLTLK